MTALALAVLAWQLTERGVERMVEAAALRDARAWAARGASLLPEIRQGPGDLAEAGRVHRLQLYDDSGTLLLDSRGEVREGQDVHAAAAAVAAQGSAQSIARGEGGRLSAASYVPLLSAGDVDGVLAVHTDETDRAATFRGAIAAWLLPALTGFVALALSLGGLLLWAERRRHRRREEEQAAARREEVARAAVTDQLTGLRNRQGLTADFEECRDLLRERDLVITLLLVEVDRLTQIGDVEGPAKVDALLAGLVEIMRSVLRAGDAAGRLDGGRFLLVLSGPRYQSPGETAARRLGEAAAADPALRCLGEPASLSVGITRVARAETTFAQAVRQADLALRAAKKEGGGGIVSYRPALEKAHERRNDVLRNVATALESGRIAPLYQPIVALDDRRIVGFEALARLTTPEGNLVEAAGFRAAILDEHLSTRISEQILQQAIVGAARLRRQGLEFGRVAVNVTEGQVADPDFAERVLDRLMLEGLSPHDMALELSEQVLLSRREARILQTLESLAAAGVELAFDDFGTGYAALSHLRRFPVGCLKLEGSFVNEVAADPAARAISTAVVDMARALERKVVAEGVETAEIDAVLREIGCDRAQGFFYSRPVPIGEVERLARSGLAA